MFTAYDGQRFDTVEKCEAHNKEVKEDMVARDEEKRLAESLRKQRLNEISELVKQVNKKITDYEKEYGCKITFTDKDAVSNVLRYVLGW